MAARRQRSAPALSLRPAYKAERLYHALNGSSAVRVARSPAIAANGMLAADLPGGGESDCAPRRQQQESGDTLPHQGIEEDVVRRFVGEIGVGSRQCGGFVMREGRGEGFGAMAGERLG